MKIVILDGYTENPGDLSWDGIKALGDLEVYDRTELNDDEEIIRRIGDAEIVVTNKTPIRKVTFDRCPNIRFIAVLATGYNIVDYEYAKEKNIPVSNVPAYGTMSVSQFAISLLLEICNQVGYYSKTVADGRWARSKDFCYWDDPLIELDKKVIGIIGFGRIGQQTGRIAGAIGMEVIAYDAFQSESGRKIGKYVELDELLTRSDVIVLHCPLTPETEGIINKDTIARMKDGVIIINNARGPLIVEADLAEALASGKVRGAGVDVVSTEPIKDDNPLLSAPNCFITPHISWASKESRKRIMTATEENIKAFLAGNPINVVNR